MKKDRNSIRLNNRISSLFAKYEVANETEKVYLRNYISELILNHRILLRLNDGRKGNVIAYALENHYYEIALVLLQNAEVLNLPIGEVSITSDGKTAYSAYEEYIFSLEYFDYEDIDGILAKADQQLYDFYMQKNGAKKALDNFFRERKLNLLLLKGEAE